MKQLEKNFDLYVNNEYLSKRRVIINNNQDNNKSDSFDKFEIVSTPNDKL